MKRSAAVWLLLTAAAAVSGEDAPKPKPQQQPKPWSLKPLVRPGVPGEQRNPIDAFAAQTHREKGLKPAGPASKATLLRRVYLDLVGLPPTPQAVDEFLADSSPDAYVKVVDRLLSDRQHGVRYARHWLDVLSYADVDEGMINEPGIHHWRDWVINALNRDVPYDQFARAQIAGDLSAKPEDVFATGFLSRAAHSATDPAEAVAFSAVENISSAFMAMTTACAKCHDHMYDPISQRDFYAMKALFDPLSIRRMTMASPQETIAHGRLFSDYEARKAAAEEPFNELIAPYRKKLYDERFAMLPPEVQPIIAKPYKERTPAEQKIADDYFPVLRIDGPKIREILPAELRAKYDELQKAVAAVKAPPELPAFWTVEVDAKKEQEKSYILTSGDPDRPETDKEVRPGWPFAPAKIDWSDGRREAFADWLTAPGNPLFARVAVNRLWQWHFGEGLQKSSSDFGTLGGTPSNQALLDWLASEFVARGFRMKAMHRLIVTSQAYRRASAVDPAAETWNTKIDSTNSHLWRFRLRRLEAEPLWDSLLTAAGDLDLTLGGRSFDLRHDAKARQFVDRAPEPDSRTNRRGAYMIRGFSTNREVTPNFLQAFDVDDGRAPCPLRTQTVTAPQSLFLMNSDVVEEASTKFAQRLSKQTGGNIEAAIDLGYRIALGRTPSPREKDVAASYVGTDAARLKGLAWLLFNLDEFVYVR